jgi:hypothetical protein
MGCLGSVFVSINRRVESRASFEILAMEILEQSNKLATITLSDSVAQHAKNVVVFPLFLSLSLSLFLSLSLHLSVCLVTVYVTRTSFASLSFAFVSHWHCVCISGGIRFAAL